MCCGPEQSTPRLRVAILRINQDETLSLVRSPKVKFARPSADVLFGSASDIYGEQMVAVVLTGAGSDGADGVQVVSRRGGFVIAQDETTSELFGMPYYAIQTGKVDLVLSLDHIGFALHTLLFAAAS